MNHYELLTVLPGTLTEDEVPAFIEKVKGELKAQGATDIAVDDQGKTRLTYPMRHIRYGYYHVYTFAFEPEQINELQAKIRLTTEFLRVLLTTFSPEKRDKDKAQRARMASHKSVARGAIERKDVEDDFLEPDTKTAVLPPETKEEASIKEVSMEDIDKKLDELLDQDIK